MSYPRSDGLLSARPFMALTGIGSAVGEDRFQMSPARSAAAGMKVPFVSAREIGVESRRFQAGVRNRSGSGDG